MFRDPENGDLLDVQIQRAPKNFNARASIFYFIYHPENVTSMNMFDTILTPTDMDKSCPALKNYPSEYWHRNFLNLLTLGVTNFEETKTGSLNRKSTGSPPEVFKNIRSCCWEPDEDKFKQQLNVEDFFGEESFQIDVFIWPYEPGRKILILIII